MNLNVRSLHAGINGQIHQTILVVGDLITSYQQIHNYGHHESCHSNHIQWNVEMKDICMSKCKNDKCKSPS